MCCNNRHKPFLHKITFKLAVKKYPFIGNSSNFKQQNCHLFKNEV